MARDGTFTEGLGKPCSGGSGIFNSMPFGRIYTDILAMQNHAGNQYQTYGRSWGSNLLGLETMDPLL